MKAGNKENSREISIKYSKVATKVAEAFASLNNVVAVVAGGSYARGFYDNYSDIEMYVYYENEIPAEMDIKEIINKLKAKLNRSKKICWFHKAWGYHTFFIVDGIKIELGYRSIEEIKNRMNSFVAKFLLPQHGLHDTPFGHYESGVANCIVTSIVLYQKPENDWINNIKNKLKDYPSRLKKDTLKYYYYDAKIIAKVKIKNAIKRNDIFLFNACLARVIRSLNICLFTLNDVYYPGDKWNHKYISNFKIIPKDYFVNMNLILDSSSLTLKNKKYIYKILNKIINDVKLLVK